MSLRIIVRRENRDELKDIMGKFHEAMVGSPAYINNEIAIVEPVSGGDAFILIVGNDNGTNHNFVITGNEMRKALSDSTDYFQKTGVLEPFDKLTAFYFDKNKGALIPDISGRTMNLEDFFIMYVARLDMEKLQDENRVMLEVDKYFDPITAPNAVVKAPTIGQTDFYYTTSTISATIYKDIRVLTLVGVIGTYPNKAYKGLMKLDNELRLKFLRNLYEIGVTYMV